MMTGKDSKIFEGIEFLDSKKINAQLTSQVINSGLQIQIIEIVSSTNDCLLEYVKNSCAVKSEPQVMLAEMQTLGKGRQGKNWVSPYGSNIYLSLYWAFNCNFSALAGLSLVVGIAAARVLSKIGLTEIKLKWPNDLYWQEKKLGGILVETWFEAGGTINAIIGIGINLKPMSDELSKDIGQPWTNLTTALGKGVSRNSLIAALISEFYDVLTIFAVSGFAKFNSEWTNYDFLAGKEGVFFISGKERSGKILGVDADGSLLIENADGVLRLFM